MIQRSCKKGLIFLNDRISNCKVDYKYVLEMNPAEDFVKNLFNKILNKHFENIYNGSESILISPVYQEGHRELLHLMFDIDDYNNPENIKSITNKIISKLLLESQDYIYELTPNGVHFVTKYYITGSNTNEIKDLYREYFSDLNIDFNASARNIPIYRMGMGKDGLVYPTKIWNSGDHARYTSKKLNEVLTEDDYKNWVTNWMFPELELHIDTFKKFFN